jgi:hypothetical protein
MAAAVNPNSDPFRGGTFAPGANPVSIGGSIAPASVGGSLIGSVAGSTPMLARNDRGTNVTIPYARVVFHPAGRTALPPVGSDKAPGPQNGTLGKPNGDLLVETEQLYSGRLVFILGRRGNNYESAMENVLGFDTMEMHGAGNVNSRTTNLLAQFAVGGVDQNTAQRLCSFEYLERYFHHVLWNKAFVIGATSVFADRAALAKKHADLALLDVDTVKSIKMTSTDSSTLLKGVNTAYRGEATDPAFPKGDNAQSGIFLYDNGPFLRGKCLDHRALLKLYGGEHNKKVPLALGDDLAFAQLQRLIAGAGACDWMPDGIVLSKLSQGDRMVDDELDSRDGQLYNVTIGGPGVASSWCNDLYKEVMPNDKVFVIIVADLWEGKGKGDIKNILGADPTQKHADYVTAKLSAAKRHTLEGGRTKDQIETKFRAADSKAVVTNMRVRLATSSEMIYCSAFKKGKENVGSVDRTSRMGLMLSGDGGVSEYIIGGWCIGTVLDSAASRAMYDGANFISGPKRARTSFAINVNVNVKWWSADRMYRCFMNRDGTNRERYDMHKGLPHKFSLPVSMRPTKPVVPTRDPPETRPAETPLETLEPTPGETPPGETPPGETPPGETRAVSP